MNKYVSILLSAKALNDKTFHIVYPEYISVLNFWTLWL